LPGSHGGDGHQDSRLHSLRRAKDLTQDELEISTEAIFNLERGISLVGMDTLERLSTGFPTGTSLHMRANLGYHPEGPSFWPITACGDIAENVRYVGIAAEAAQGLASAGLHGEAIQALLDAEPHLYDARKYLELAAFVRRKTN
jgi:transcriptional regulator with XRE-family HTH domain